MTLRSQGHLFLTASAGNNVHMAGNAYWDGTVWRTYDATKGSCWWWAGSDGTGQFLTAPAGATPAYTARLYINNAGAVALGSVTSPQAKWLHVPYSGSSANTVQLGDTSYFGGNSFELGVGVPSGQGHWPFGVCVGGTRYLSVAA